MISITKTYSDYNNKERTETFNFHLNKAELTEMELTVNGGLSAMIDTAVKANNNATLIKVFKELVLRSYGVKSDDGRRFIKSEELSKEFSQTEAYSIIFMELATDADMASKFVNGIVPADLSKSAAASKSE